MTEWRIEHLASEMILPVAGNIQVFWQFLFVEPSALEVGPFKELGPRTAKLALSICLTLKMVEYVTESSNAANGSMLISCL